MFPLSSSRLGSFLLASLPVFFFPLQKLRKKEGKEAASGNFTQPFASRHSFLPSPFPSSSSSSSFEEERQHFLPQQLRVDLHQRSGLASFVWDVVGFLISRQGHWANVLGNPHNRKEKPLFLFLLTSYPLFLLVLPFVT